MAASSTVTAFGPDPTYAYLYNPKAEERAPSWALVPTVMDVEVSGVAPDKCMLTLHPGALPFGLVESVELVLHTAAALPDYRFHFVKSTGSRESERCGVWGRRVALTQGTLRNDHDATHADIAAVYRDTGHQMACRMVAGSSIMSLCVEMYGPPPPTFTVRFHGANTIPAERVGTALVPPLPMGMPPITALRRAQLATAAAEETTKAAAAAATS